MAPPNQPTTAAGAFTHATADRALRSACVAQGLSERSAQLVRFGENAIYRIPEHCVVARVARYPETSRNEVLVANWLSEHDFPAARLAAELEQLQEFDGTVVTWWELIEESDTPPTFLDLAGILRRLHDLPPPAEPLPQFAPMPLVPLRLAVLASDGRLPSEDLQWLRRHHAQLHEQYEQLAFELQSGPIHGDAHKGNLMRGVDGQVRLIDFEVFSHGPREWDVAILGIAWDGFGWMGELEYRACVDEYGFDPVAWRGYPIVRGIRELNMTTWLAQRLGESVELDREVRQRLGDLRDGSAVRQWRPF